MTNNLPDSTFPNTRQDLSNLKKTAVDAARDITSTATVHAQKAQDNLKDLAGHAKEEGSDQIDQVKAGLTNLSDQVSDYISARPLASVGIALAVGFLLGLSRRSFSANA